RAVPGGAGGRGRRRWGARGERGRGRGAEGVRGYGREDGPAGAATAAAVRRRAGPRGGGAAGDPGKGGRETVGSAVRTEGACKPASHPGPHSGPYKSRAGFGASRFRPRSVGVHALAELAQRLALDLADALAGQAEPLADLLERLGLLVVQAEAH